MRYFILFLGIMAIAIVSVINFYPEETKEFIYDLVNNREYIIAKANDYYLESNFNYIKNYTDDVSSKEELIDYIYYSY